MEQEFEILEEGDRHFIAEVEDETYLVEDEGFNSEEGVYEFTVGDSETPYGASDNFGTPNRVRLLEREADSFSSYEEAAEIILEKGINGGKRKGLAGLNQFY